MESPKYERCLKCNRPLKSELAKIRGYGAHCWKIHNIEITKKKVAIYEIIPQK